MVIIKQRLFPFFIIALFAVIIACLVAVTSRKPIAQVHGKEVYDWGSVLEGALLSHDFILKNTGNKVLLVKKLKTSCGCVEAKIASSEIKPKEQTSITVKYRGRPLTKREVIQVWVETNDPKKPMTRLVMTGKVELQVFWHPTAVSFFYNYGEIQEPKYVNIITDLYDDFVLEEILTSNDKYLFSITENSKGYTCKVEPTPNCPKGNWTESIILKAKIADYVREINIPVNLMVH